MPTIGEVYGPAMEIQTPEEAAAFIEKEIQRHVEEFGQDREEARRVILGNVGYYAGYYDSKTRERVYRLFNTEHPLFGKMSPTADEALNAGIKQAGKGGDHA